MDQPLDSCHPASAHSAPASRRPFAARCVVPFIAGCVCTVLVGAFMSRDASFSQHAFAGPPGSSALSIQQNENAQKLLDAFDSGKQRAELVGELRSIRQEVSDLRALVTNGKMTSRIANFDEMPLDRMKLEIDYTKLAQAVKTAMKSE